MISYFSIGQSVDIPSFGHTFHAIVKKVDRNYVHVVFGDGSEGIVLAYEVFKHVPKTI